MFHHALKRHSSMRTGTLFFLVWYMLMIVWWLTLNSRHLADTNENYAFGLVFGLIPLAGGLLGFVRSKHWGGRRSAMGRATFYLSAGLVFWALGGLIWAYYNFFGAIEVPYPSWADVAYVVSWPLWSIGIIHLSRATGARFSLRHVRGKLQLFVIPVMVAAISYSLLVIVGRGGELVVNDSFWKIFFDLAYPIGDLVILSLALLVYGLSFGYLGGRFKIPIWTLLAGFVANYAADFAFSWTTTQGTFFVGGFVDLLFMTAMTLLALGVTTLNPNVPATG
jgi:hypothetical protein